MLKSLIVTLIFVSAMAVNLIAQASFHSDKNVKPTATEFDLSALPAYRSETKVKGAIRNFGNGLDGLLQL